MDLYRNDNFRLYLDGINVWIDCTSLGFDIKDFGMVNEILPRFKLTNYGHLNKALQMLSNGPIIIGVYRNKIEIEVSKDELEAWMTVYMSSADYERDKDTLQQDMLAAINQAGLKVGVIREALKGQPVLLEKFLIAKGIAPEPGTDAVISYYQLSEKKPRTQSDGKVNHYELDLIDNVVVGEWLGEKIPATPGKTGTSVLGTEIPTKVGRDYSIKFDAKSVGRNIEENGKETLYALKDGAVKFEGGKIMVDNHLRIDGDVDYTTGNIDFDGFVTISGTVQDGFSVVGKFDVTIDSQMGIGAVGEIRSTHGSVLIKGGVNGKNVAKINAYNNVYLKYCNECEVIAGNQINVGFYAMECQLKAKKVIIDPIQGRLIGGRVEAEHQLIAGSIGNTSERKTEVNVQGFERGNVKFELDALLINYKDLISKGNKLKRQLDIFESNMGKLDEVALNTYKAMRISYEHLIEDIQRMNQKVGYFQDVLKTRGDGEIKISHSAYPKTFIEIKRLQKRVKETLSGSIYVQDNNMHFEG